MVRGTRSTKILFLQSTNKKKTVLIFEPGRLVAVVLAMCDAYATALRSKIAVCVGWLWWVTRKSSWLVCKCNVESLRRRRDLSFVVVLAAFVRSIISRTLLP